MSKVFVYDAVQPLERLERSKPLFAFDPAGGACVLSEGQIYAILGLPAPRLRPLRRRRLSELASAKPMCSNL